MVQEVTRHDVQRLVAQGARLVDVLDEKEFADSHLPGAVSLPLPALAGQALRQLDPDQPTVVYCYDSGCDLSPRGAARLVSLGFNAVYDYVASKMDWIAAGLPFEGTRNSAPHLASLATRDVPTCELGQTTADARDRIGDAPICVVVDDRRVVLGTVSAATLASPAAPAFVAEAMDEAPKTFRPHVTAVEAAKSLDKKPRPWMLVTNLDGTLVGLADPVRVVDAASSTAGASV
jgi:rhodanese-related sulfurtransferase